MTFVRSVWLEARRKGMCGTDTSKVLNMSDHGAGFSVWLDKLGKSKTRPESWVHIRGHLCEPWILKRYAEETGQEVTPNDRIITGPEPWMLGTPDGFVGMPGLSDSKSSRDWEIWGPPGDYHSARDLNAAGAIPKTARCQGYWYLAVTGCEWIDFPVAMIPHREDGIVQSLYYSLVNADMATPDSVSHLGRWLVEQCDVSVYRMYRDQKVIDAIVNRCREWWERYIVGGERPLMDGSDDAYRFLREEVTGQDLEDERVEVSGDMGNLLYRAARLHPGPKKAKEVYDLSRNLLLEAMSREGLRRIEGPGGKATISKAGSCLVYPEKTK